MKNRRHYRMYLIVVICIALAGLLFIWLRPDPHLRKSIRIGTPLIAIAISSDSQLLATIDTQRQANVHHLATNRLHWAPEGYPCFATSITFHPSTAELAIGYTNGAVILWDATDGTPLRSIIAGAPPTDTHESQCAEHDRWKRITGKEINQLAFSPDGNLLAVSVARTTFVHHRATGDRLYTLREHSRDVIRDTVFSADGQFLAVGVGKRVHLWNMHNGQSLTTMLPSGVSHSVTSIAFQSEQSRLVIGRRSLDVEVWSIRENRRISSKSFVPERPSSLAFNADGTTFAWGGPTNRGIFGGTPVIGAHDTTIYVGGLGDSDVRQELSGHQDIVTDLTFSADSRLLISGSLDKTVRIWDVPQLDK